MSLEEKLHFVKTFDFTLPGILLCNRISLLTSSPSSILIFPEAFHFHFSVNLNTIFFLTCIKSTITLFSHSQQLGWDRPAPEIGGCKIGLESLLAESIGFFWPKTETRGISCLQASKGATPSTKQDHELHIQKAQNKY